MKILKFVGLLGLISVFLMGGIAFSQGGGQGMGGQGTSPKNGCQNRFDELDANRDGKVTREEFLAVPHHMANAEQNFKAMDMNSDGVLSSEEFCAQKGRVRGTGGNR